MTGIELTELGRVKPFRVKPFERDEMDEHFNAEVDLVA